MKRNLVNQLLSGHGAAYKRYRGHHVLVSGKRVVPLRRGKAGLQAFQKLTRETGKPPVVVFVPREDVTYILSLCL